MLSRNFCFSAAFFLSVMSAVQARGETERTLSEAPIADAAVKGRRVNVSFDRDEARYAIGEAVGLFIDAREDAYVTVLTISPNGGVVQLFPNKYQTDGFVAAGKRVQVPDPASGAKLEVSGPVGTEQIRVFSSAKPLKIFANLGQGGGGMFRSLDGGIDAVSRSLDEARSGGARIGSETRTLTTVETPPPAAPAPSAPPKVASAAPDVAPPPEKPEKPPKTASAAKPAKPKVEKPRRPAKVPASATRRPEDEEPIRLELVGKLPAEGGDVRRKPIVRLPQGATPDQQSASAGMQTPQFQMPQMQMPQMPQMQMPQMQMPQMQMPQIQVPQVQMPQIQLPGGMQLQMPQIQLPFGRSAEREDGAPDGTAAAGDAHCRDLLARFNAAVAAKDIQAAAADADAIAVNAVCGGFQVPAQRRIAALRLSAAQAMMQAARPAEEYEPLLSAAESPQVLWQASAALGEVRFAERRFAEAAVDYQEAIEIIKNESRTPKAPAEEAIRGLIDRAGQARILAANPSPQSAQGTFVPVGKDNRSGMLGGIYSQDVRGIVPVSIPVPITFDFNKATFTPIGSQAARELLEAIREQKPDRVVLVGHADRRGTDSYNQALSAKRAGAVAAFLRENGVEASIDAEGRGASQPIDIAVTANLSDDDIDALNRRVEWRRE